MRAPCGTCGNLGARIDSGLHQCAALQGYVGLREMRDCSYRIPHVDPSTPLGTWNGLQGWHRRALLDMAERQEVGPYAQGFMGSKHDRLVELGLATSKPGADLPTHEGKHATKLYRLTQAGWAVVKAAEGRE